MWKKFHIKTIFRGSNPMGYNAHVQCQNTIIKLKKSTWSSNVEHTNKMGITWGLCGSNISFVFKI